MIKYKLEEDGIYIMGMLAGRESVAKAKGVACIEQEIMQLKKETTRYKQETIQIRKSITIAIIKLRNAKILEIAEIADIFNVSETYVLNLKA